MALISLPNKAYALTENNENLPSSVLTHFFFNAGCWNPAGNRNERHGQYTWLSPAGWSAEETITLAPGQDSVDVWLNAATVQCNSNVAANGNLIDRTLQRTRATTTHMTITAGTISSYTNIVTLNMDCSNFFNLRWVKICGQGPYDAWPAHQDITISNLGGLPPGTHNVTITATQRLIHQYSNGAFVCVAQVNGNYVPANSLSDTRCGTITQSRTITVIVPNPPNAGNCSVAISGGNILNPGETRRVDYTVRNTGGWIWSVYPLNSQRHRLRNQNPAPWAGAPTELEIAGSGVENNPVYGPLFRPGGATSWRQDITIPPGLAPGNYTFNWRIYGHTTASGFQWVGSSCPVTIRVELPVTRPYFRVYGGDTVVGRGFAQGQTNICTANNDARIRAFARDRGAAGWAGAGSELAARATGLIDGFLSASTRTTAPTAATGLTFGNKTPTNSTINNFSPTQPGSDSTAYAGCIPDYYAEFVNERYETAAELNRYNLAHASNATGTTANNTNGTWSGTTISPANSGYYFYDGDLVITDNVSLTDYTSGNPADIPKFFLIVRGNLYIAPTVTQLDGIYIAQPRPDGSGGTINTCAAPSATFQACTLHQLTVNGALLAKQVQLNRLRGDVDHASVQPREGNTAPQIAEIFNFRPDLLLSTAGDTPDPDLRPRDYDSIVGLPPVL